METILLVVHLIIVVSLVLVILIQRPSTDGLSGLGGGGGSNPAMNIRGSANVLTRMTSFLAASFMITSLGLAYLASEDAQKDILRDASVVTPTVIEGGVEVPAATEEAEPVVPLAE